MNRQPRWKLGCLKLAIDLAATILSGSKCHILITRLLKNVLCSETIRNLANLKRISQVEGYSEHLKKHED